MGYESSRTARRRLAALAASNTLIQEALAPSAFPGLFDDFERDEMPAPAPAAAPAAAPAPMPPAALVAQLDALAMDIVSTPGAGGALLASYAAQARALSLVIEAAKRAGGGPLPAAVLVAAQSALVPPHVLAGLPLG